MIALASMTLAGCDGIFPAKSSEPVQITFEFYLDGDPLRGAHVVTLPMLAWDDQGQPNALTFGTTNGLGKAEFQSVKSARGLTPGWHWVIVSRQSPQSDEFSLPPNEKDLFQWTPQQIVELRDREQIPAAYNWSSRLRIHIPADWPAGEPYKIELTSQPSTGFPQSVSLN